MDDETFERLKAELVQDTLAAMKTPLHHPRTERMVDEEAALADVQVCDHCFHLVYPYGCDDEYVDPDVFWPCPTERERNA
jgi:hypothetical protein